MCEARLGCDFTIKFHCVTCSPSPYSLLPPTYLSNENNRSLNEGGGRMKLSRAGAWDISLVENSDITQLFIIVNCLGGWPAFMWHYGNIPFTKDSHPSFSISPFFGRVTFLLPPNTTVPFGLLIICTQVLFTSEALRLYITVTYKFAYMEYIF